MCLIFLIGPPEKLTWIPQNDAIFEAGLVHFKNHHVWYLCLLLGAYLQIKFPNIRYNPLNQVDGHTAD